MIGNGIAFGLLIVTLAIAAVTDVRQGKVYNWLTYPAILAGLVFWLGYGLLVAGEGPSGAGQNKDIVAALVGFGAAIVPMLVIRLAGGLGGGDVKLMGAVGAISASWRCVLSTGVYALLVGLVIGLAMMVVSGRTKQTLARLLGIALTAGAGSKPTVSDEQSPQVPFALAIAVGGIVAAAEQLLGWQSPWAWLSP
jgi:prepilin peptidase CpaA